MEPAAAMNRAPRLSSISLALCLTLLSPSVSMKAEEPNATQSQQTAPRQFILLNRAPGQGMNQAVPSSLGPQNFTEILEHFPHQPDAAVQTGVSFIFSPFRTPPETTLAALRQFLHSAETTNTPVLVQIDTEQWWEARPDLWNWWDPSRPGFDPANRENVERTGYALETALRIGWRNWGSQIRVLPPPNLAAPRYIEACRTEIRRLVPVILDWYRQLPQPKKQLFVGIKLGHETSIGVNTFHYPDGNALLEQPAEKDPVSGLQTDDVPARGVALIGYAAVSSAGFRSTGAPTEADLTRVAREYLETLCREAANLGVPRDRLFAHGAGWKEGELAYDIPINAYACPGWSFYKHAPDPGQDSGVQRNLARSNAPYWAATEWLLHGTEATEAWRNALSNTLADPRCRYVCIFNWESILDNPGAQQAIANLTQPPAP